MTVTLQMTPELAQTLHDSDAASGTDAASLQQILRELLGQMEPPPSTLLKSKKSERVAGLHAGQIQIGDDFDAPLPDAFWLGEE